MFTPGQIIKSFISKKGNSVVLRTPRNEDVPIMTQFINEISLEDTFITFSGEQLSLEEEQKYLGEVLEKQAKGDEFKLFAFINDVLVGNSDVTRGERRSKHVGHIGLSVKKEYRGEGIGYEMMIALIDAAKKMNLKLLELSCLSLNIAGLNLYKKVGFIEHGRFPKAVLFKGAYIDLIQMHREV